VAIDDNPDRAQFDNQIAPYLDRWRAHLHGAGLKLGVYANAPTIDWCRSRGLGEYFWQHDWGSNGRLNPAATIHQLPVKQQVTVGAVESDLNRVYAADFGPWWALAPLVLAATTHPLAVRQQVPVGRAESDLIRVYGADVGQGWDLDPLVLAGAALGSSA